VSKRQLTALHFGKWSVRSFPASHAAPSNFNYQGDMFAISRDRAAPGTPHTVADRRATYALRGTGTPWWPDDPGNNMLNTWVIWRPTPTAALLFFDFGTGSTLRPSGTDDVGWDAKGPGDDGGTSRCVRLTGQTVTAGPQAGGARRRRWRLSLQPAGDRRPERPRR
jgi:hypothetical protein